ncbi:MAG: hypothetical protein ABR583_02685 [Gaiellaceae bacterium]
MAQVMKMRWEGFTPDKYDALRPIVRWETEPPEGLVFHVAWFRDGGIVVVDVWESQEQFDRFFQDRLMPGIQQVGMEGQPTTNWYEAHAYFNSRVPATAAV